MKHSLRIHTSVAAFLLLFGTEAFAQPVFINEIPIPPLYEASAGPIDLQMQQSTHKFNPGNPSDTLNGISGTQPNGIPAYTYNLAGNYTMTLLGPTLKWRTFDTTVISIKNLIGVSTTTHWHGAEVPSNMDGGPHQEILPGDTWHVGFRTVDSASTLWYHPHYHNLTLEHVQKGLSGMVIVELPNDQIRNTLPRTYGVDDIPVIIGDLSVLRDTSTNTMYIDTLKGNRPYNLVNGVTNPYLEVPAAMVRLRVLNGSTRKGLMVGFSTSYDSAYSTLKPFYMIATDGGYTMKPDTMTMLMSGPGARNEIILDLTGYQPGDTVYLSNLKNLLPTSVIGNPESGNTHSNAKSGDTTIGNAFLQLRIVSNDSFPGYTPVTTFTPFTNTWSPGLADTSNVVRHRLKQLVTTAKRSTFTINGLPYDMEFINDTVCVDTKEIWAIQNKTEVAHPFHIHKIQFRVLDVVDSLGNYLDLDSLGLNGPKDDVLVLPGWTLRFLGQFDDYPSAIDPMNTYMYHCHILTHEDSIGGGMMHQFVVAACETSPGSVSSPEKISMDLSVNAADGSLTLKGISGQPSTFTLFDVQGRAVRSEQLAAVHGKVRISIEGLPSGIYMAEWRTQKGVATGKVMVTK